MATASGTGVWVAKGAYKRTWVLTSTATVGKPDCLVGLPDKTVSVRGTFAGTGTVSVTLFGSNQSATVIAAGALATAGCFALNDSRGEGNALTFTAIDGRQVNENSNRIFPKLTVVSGNTAITVEVGAQSTKR